MTLHPIFGDILSGWMREMQGVYATFDEEEALAEVEEARHEDYFALCLEWLNMAEGVKVTDRWRWW